MCADRENRKAAWGHVRAQNAAVAGDAKRRSRRLRGLLPSPSMAFLPRAVSFQTEFLPEFHTARNQEGEERGTFIF